MGLVKYSESILRCYLSTFTCYCNTKQNSISKIQRLRRSVGIIGFTTFYISGAAIWPEKIAESCVHSVTRIDALVGTR